MNNNLFLDGFKDLTEVAQDLHAEIYDELLSGYDSHTLFSTEILSRLKDTLESGEALGHLAEALGLRLREPDGDKEDDGLCPSFQLAVEELHSFYEEEEKKL